MEIENHMKPTAIDLFCGAGGLTMGLEEAGFQTVMAIDSEPNSCATYRAAFPDVKLFRADARRVDYRRWRWVDFVAGGPPCQPFSTGGLRQGQADDRDLLPVFVRAVLEIAPRAFLLENVPGLASPAHQGYLRDVLGPLFERYRVVGPIVLNAADYGVPQNRRRLFVMGTIDALPEIPAAACRRVAAGEVLTREPRGEPNASKIVYAKTPDLRPDPYHGQLFNGGGRPIDLDRPAPTILASAGGNKTHFLDLGKRVPPYHAYLLGGGKPRSGELPEARRLTVAESAVLQTFPDEMRFHGPRSSQYTQVGNAVPPKMAEMVGIAILEAIARARAA
jgi:DNA (cytosine-5)-methyltransferase 1